jgi:ABC-type antimicrobial peptide transport system permease subunit
MPRWRKSYRFGFTGETLRLPESAVFNRQFPAIVDRRARGFDSTNGGASSLGLGVRAPTPSWGNLLEEAARFYRTNWTNVFFPDLIIYLASLALYLVGIGLRDMLDPKLGD